MGSIHYGIPPWLMEAFKVTFEIPAFIETGTDSGQTALWAANIFEQVYTIEASESRYQKAQENVSWPTNVKAIFGNSKEALFPVIQALSPLKGAAFWLDAHWCNNDSYGKDDECPLLEEIRLVNQFTGNRFILIDDARLFTAPPPEPHNAAQWPNLADIIEVLNSPVDGKKPFLMIYNDVIIAVPLAAKSTLMEFCAQRKSKKPQEETSLIPN